MIVRLFWIFLVFIAFSIPSSAQEGDKLGSWYVYNGFFNFSPKFELFAETQIRTWEPISNAQTLFLRPFFNFNLNSNIQLGISQEYHASRSFVEGDEEPTRSEEYRTALQGMIFHNVDRVSFQHRYRYEFRFLDEDGKRRVRYRLQLGVPISDQKMAKGVWFTTIGNEVMLNSKPEFNVSQNRAYAMLGYQLSTSIHLQVGYMHISRPTQENLRRLQFFITQKLWFYDK